VPDLSDHLQAQGLVVHHKAPDEALHVFQDLVLHHQHGQEEPWSTPQMPR